MRAFSIALALSLAMAGAPPAAAQTARPAALGVQLNDMAEPGKILVHKVMPGLTAHAVGLKEGDELVEINGTRPSNADAVVALVGTLKAGDPVKMIVRRAGAQLELSGTAAARPEGMQTGRLQGEPPPGGTSN